MVSKFLQFELLDSEEIRRQKQTDFDKQLDLLPTDPMQEKYTLDKVTLTDREFEILHLILSGHSIGEIAVKIFLSISGVKFRLSSIYWKFGVRNRLELIKKSTQDSLQFYTKSGIKHVFHNRLSMADYQSITEKKDDLDL